MHFSGFYHSIFLVKESFDPHEWHDRVFNVAWKIIHTFLENPKGTLVLRRIPAKRLKSIWLEFGKRNTISDLSGLDKIAECLLDGIASLRVTTQLQGHTDDGLGYHEVFERIMDWSEEETDAQVDADDLYNFLVVDDESNGGTEFLSDYGLAPLERLVPRIADEENPEQRLYAIDKAINIIHARSDLAAFFVEGGSATLLDVANQGGYTSQ